jgi:large subunit ribosomal protein L16
MLRPRELSYKKVRKGRLRGVESKNPYLKGGTFGLRALESGRITARQIEATRRAITRKMNRRGRVWILIFPQTPVTSKPIEVRMGKGKGAVNYWVSSIRKGRLLFLVGGVSREVAFEALRAGAGKLPLLTAREAGED